MCFSIRKHPDDARGYCCPALFFFGGVAVLLHGTAWEYRQCAGGLSAACYLYCQMRMLHACKGILSWCEPALKPYMLVTGVVEGLGVALCVPAVTGDKAAWSALAALLLLRALLWFGLRPRCTGIGHRRTAAPRLTACAGPIYAARASAACPVAVPGTAHGIWPAGHSSRLAGGEFRLVCQAHDHNPGGTDSRIRHSPRTPCAAGEKSCTQQLV